MDKDVVACMMKSGMAVNWQQLMTDFSGEGIQSRLMLWI
jgi:hypothetical protein